MLHVLTRHPDSACAAAVRIEVDASRPHPDVLALRYSVIGAIGALRLPPRAAPARADELWKHTCFEAFLRAPQDEAYYEFNFSPSTLWAAYRFSGYREGMTVAGEAAAPDIETHSADGAYTLSVSLDLGGLRLPRDDAWRLALSAVIEEQNGRKSYWALAHPPGRPDFHHAHGFACALNGQ
jgi:hypothetical protein